MYTYKQESKKQVRHTTIRKAVELLTAKRSDACCVRNSYVRDLYDYFLEQAETKEKSEAEKIEMSYIREWERMHMISIGIKRPDELSVCYLSGPEPQNDFNEFVALGVLPQNIWAFECESNIYQQALIEVDGSKYMQPKIVKTKIEHFFKNTPKTFDIVYIDACATLVSSRHALRCVSSLFQYHRLNSPGIVITNFAYLDETNETDKKQYIDMIARYKFALCKNTPVLLDRNGSFSFVAEFKDTLQSVTNDLEKAYGDFITNMICNSASISVPALRFCNSQFLNVISSTTPIVNRSYNIPTINTINNNTLYKYFATNCLAEQQKVQFHGIRRGQLLSSELSSETWRYDLLSCLNTLYEAKSIDTHISPSLRAAADFFDDSGSLFQFLDKPNRILLIDSIVNQLSYPMHYVTDKALRFTYVAKQTRMYTDLLLFDECRYIYDWLPAIDQIKTAFSNPSWQYTFRFALDGLIKQRLNYNNEFFFQGSVVSKNTEGFEAKTFPKRIKVS